MGNRGGRLHQPDQRLGRARWKSRAWICCRTEFPGRRRTVMGTGYTEIFFLDEATALAAGHRPCFECRRADACAFAEAWARARHLDAPPRASEMDRVLHAERRDTASRVRLGDLPAGTIYRWQGNFLLGTSGSALRWTFAGY